MTTDNSNPHNVIESYRRRQKTMPVIIGVLAFLLVAAGVVIVVMALRSPGGNPFKPTDTPTATFTATATVTKTPVPPTFTATITVTKSSTPTLANTATAAGPFEYSVQEGDTCWSIANKYKVDLIVLMTLNNLAGNCPIQPGMKIMIPNSGLALPSSTPVPATLPRGTRIDYIVQNNDTLETIAGKFNSTVDAIIAIAENNISNANDIRIGQKLIIPVNIATPTPTRGPTSTIAITLVPVTNTPTRPSATATKPSATASKLP